MSQKPVSSTFQTLLIFFIIFSPLDLVFFSTNFTENSQSPELAAYSHSAADSPKKVSPKTPPKKVESSPTTHVTETSVLHVLDPPDLFCHFFTFGLSFFSTNFTEKSQSPELAAYSHSAADSPKKLVSKNTTKIGRVQPHNPRHRNQFSPRFRPS